MEIKRDILHDLKRWKERHDRKPLIVHGARQIGKTTAIRAFGKECYEYVAEFNFDKQRELADIFSKTKDPSRIITELASTCRVPILPGRTLIFFDEIQECEDALNSLKYFDEDAKEYHIISAGSLLGVALRKDGATFPVGKVNYLQMYPVTFREFLRSADKELFDYADGLTELSPIPELLHSRLIDRFKQYQICGGLPYICMAMLKNEGVDAVESKLAEMLASYTNDFSKHIDSKDITRIHEIWHSMPSQLAKENKKFIFRVVREGARAREYEAALQWLILAGLVYKVTVVDKPGLPLNFYEDISCFKICMFDIGVLRKLSGLPVEVISSSSEMFTEFKGAVAENYVLTSLLAQGFSDPHYWTLPGNKAEVDFIITQGLEVIPIEVKSAERISGKSFAEYDKKYSPDLRIRFSLKNLKRDGNLINIPLYLADWTKEKFLSKK